MDLADRTGVVNVLCLNAGSSSIKLSVREPGADAPALTGAVEGIGEAEGRLWLRDAGGEPKIDDPQPSGGHDDALGRLLEAVNRAGAPPFDAIGHRVVHGGRHLTASTLIDGNVRRTLADLVTLAPLHLPPQLAVIDAVTARFPDIPQVACFDTAFHRGMPEIAQRFPLPEWAWDAGICRFGFHGLSYRHVMDVLGPQSGRVVIAHLGNGCSMAAVDDGVPMDTTMAFTPAAGLMMGTRCGDLDPGLITHLVGARGLTAAEVDHLVNHESGLLGVSGTTGDMRELLELRDRDPRADRAVTMFCRIARRSVGALAAVLGGLDQLVFTGGIGERAAAVRAEICAGLEHLGVHLDPDRNAAAAADLSAPGASCTVRIVPADENSLIARDTVAIVGGSAPGRA